MVLHSVFWVLVHSSPTLWVALTIGGGGCADVEQVGGGAPGCSSGALVPARLSGAAFVQVSFQLRRGVWGG